PLPLEKIRTHFMFFDYKNKENVKFISYFDTGSIKSLLSYDKLYIIAHGWRRSPSVFTGMKEKLLALERNNFPAVILVNWELGAKTSITHCAIQNTANIVYCMYGQPAVNTIVVGREIAVLVDLLVKMGKVRAKDVHLIGFSLGAQ